MTSSPWWQQDCRLPDSAAEAAALARQAQLTKPTGALGELEAVAVRLAALQGREKPAVTQPQLVLFAGDHGVVAEGVSAYPQAVTAQMLGNFVAGGAAVSVLARRRAGDDARAVRGSAAGRARCGAASAGRGLRPAAGRRDGHRQYQRRHRPGLRSE
jgi:nicotinate-nucleotide--dimethylbenzimidazole phosphoribosyltransferase